IGPMQVGQLNCEQAHCAGSSVNQHAFAGLQLCAIEEPLPCCQSSDRHGGRKFVSQSFWLERDALRQGDAELRSGATCEPFVHAVDFVSDIEIMNTLPECCYDARELMSRHRVCACASIFCVRSGIPE